MESDSSVQVVAQLINLWFMLMLVSLESIEFLSASSSGASHQNFLTPTLHDLIFLFLYFCSNSRVPTP